MPKKLFYASASILMLALAYHLGGAAARANVSATIEVPSFNGSWVSGVMGRTVYTACCGGGPQCPFVVQILGGIPGTDPVIASSSGGNVDFVLLANGDIYRGDLSTAAWTLAGNLNGATPAARQTFGQLKAQYRR